MRCLALAQEWKERGGDAIFLCSVIPDAIENRLSAEGFSTVHIPARPGSDEDAVHTVRELARHGGQLLVVDGVRFGRSWQRQVKQTGARLLFLEDNGTAPPYCADWIWNADLPVRREVYKECEPHTKLLLGPEYLLLRREFLEAAPRASTSTAIRKILITMGGSDPENFSERTINGVRQVRQRGWKVRLIAGPANPHLEKVKMAVRGIDAELLPAVDNMAEHVAWADIAFTVEGGTLWEILYMGVPVICWSREDPVSLLLSELRSRGLVIALGCNTEPAVLAGIFADVANNRPRLTAMRDRARKVADGKGAERVAHELLRGISD
jgi:spore coat polysaccharide biosynthesis predicted glycosyltransferase SpsG